MVAIHETAYPRLKPNLTQQELVQNFLPSKNEITLLKASTNIKSPYNQIGFMFSLKCYQCLGYHIAVTSIPIAIVTYIAQSIKVLGSKKNLKKYMLSKQRKRHKSIIRKFIEIKEDKKHRKKIMKISSLKSAATKDKINEVYCY